MVKFNSAISGIRPKVLIIDDEESVRVALRAVLQADYEILEAESAAQAFEILKSNRADLVTLDVLMPGKNGLETLRDIRRSGSNNDVPVIMITGHASVDSACEALRLGASDYLQKPFSIDELKKSVRKGLRRPENLSAEASEVEEEEDEMLEVGKEIGRENLVRLGKASAAFVHDLASPLQVLTILNNLCLQRIAAAPASPQMDEIREVAEQMERLFTWSSELVKGWQSIAIPGACSNESLEAGAVLERVVEIVSPYAKLNSVSIKMQPTPLPIWVQADRVQLERALVNLCLNGIKASTARGRTLEVSVRAFQDSHVFRFADTGLGFSPERMKEVLTGDPFYSVTKKRRGLGLFIADWIAVNHGGKLQFICEKGLGTTVEFFLPANTR